MQPTMVVLRFFHVVSGVLWVGGVGVLSMFLAPAIQGSGPNGAAVMRHLIIKTKFGAYFPALGGLTVLSGIWMYWHNSAVSQGAFNASATGITLGIGGLFGLIALIFGGLVVGRSVGQLGTVMKTLDGSAAPTADQAARMAALRDKITWGSKIVLPMLILAAACMAIARYV
jgi:uncharacterized membrane protein